MLYFVCYIFQAPYIATTNFFELVFVFENREKKKNTNKFGLLGLVRAAALPGASSSTCLSCMQCRCRRRRRLSRREHSATVRKPK
jgi:hypothetical protein